MAKKLVRTIISNDLHKEILKEKTRLEIKEKSKVKQRRRRIDMELACNEIVKKIRR